MVHEFAHALFCRFTGTPVHQVCYFRFGNPAGFVLHEPPATVWKQLWISGGPFVVNTIVGFLIGMLAFLTIPRSPEWQVPRFIAGWLAASVAMHAFPSRPDAVSSWRAVRAKEAPLSAKIIGTPVAALMYLAALFAVGMVDLVYGLVIGVLIPLLLLK